LAENLKKNYKVKYNNEKFPGMFLKLDLGTIIIFHTGSLICIGVNNPSDLDQLYSELMKIIEKSS